MLMPFIKIQHFHFRITSNSYFSCDSSITLLRPSLIYTNANLYYCTNVFNIDNTRHLKYLLITYHKLCSLQNHHPLHYVKKKIYVYEIGGMLDFAAVNCFYSHLPAQCNVRCSSSVNDHHTTLCSLSASRSQS